MTKKTIARISGISYLFIFTTGFYANFAVVESLIDLSDATKTVQNLSMNIDQFSYGILGFLVMIFFDAILVWTLYKLFEKVDNRISLVASSFRLINVIFFGVALSKLVVVYFMLNDLGSNLITPDQILSLVKYFNKIWIVGLIFFGIHLVLLGFLIIKSSFAPKWIGILLTAASAGYMIDGFANLYLPSYDTYKNVFMLIVVIPGVLGEFSLTLWLIFSRKFGIKNKSSMTYR